MAGPLTATKIFWSALSAILVAGIIFAIAWICIKSLDDWEKRKSETIAAMNKLDRMTEAAYRESKGGSLSELTAALGVMNRAAEQKKEAIVVLRTILESKPIFPLTSDEKQLLVSIKAQEKDGSQNNENTSPSPNPAGDTAIHEENVIRDGSATSSPTVAPAETPQPVSYPILTLTKPVELKDSIGHVVAKLPKGQSLQYRYRDGYQALVLYEGGDYPVRISSTDLE